MRFADLGGSHLGGLKAGSNGEVWAGMLTRTSELWNQYTAFSDIGLISMAGGGALKRFHRGNSPLPSDTVLLAAPAPDGSVWLTCDKQKLLRFMPPDKLDTLALALPLHVNSLEVDTLGRPYLGTCMPSGGISVSTATGLYRVEGDSLVSLGYYLGSNPAIAPHKRHGQAAGPGFSFRIPAQSQGAGARWLDAMGRQAARVTAARLYLPLGDGRPSK
jgi:hypothetical protein